MQNKKALIEGYNDLLYDIYLEHDLQCLFDNEANYNGRNVLGAGGTAEVASVSSGLHERLNEATDSLRLPRFERMHAEGEILSVSADIKYRLGTLYLYLPYTVELHNSHYNFEGVKQFFLEPTRFDARFNREVPIAFEALYKFWQRLMDFVLSYFPEELLRVKGISYFHTAIQYIEKHQPQLTASENFKWIRDFADNQYPKINQRRKHFVHTEGYENKFSREFLESDTTSLADMLKLEQQREELPAFLKEQMFFCMEGYFKAMDFLNELKSKIDANTKKITYSLT